MSDKGRRKSKLWYISNTRLLSGLTERDKAELLSKLKEVEVGRKSFVYASGDPPGTVYILKEGRIKISHITEEGKELTLDILSPGDIFGEDALGGEEERWSSAEALEDSFVCVMKRRDFEEFLARRPDLSLAVTKWMGSRIRRIESRLEELIFQDVRSRLVAVLNDLADKYGEPVKGGRRISVRLSHQEIANLVGAARETVTAELNSLKRSGEILVDKRHIIIPSKSPS